MPWNKGGKVSKLINSEGEIIQIKDFYLTKISLLPLCLVAIMLRSGMAAITPRDKCCSVLD